jgi:DMSO/TMAO reductase YedYZ heme-binding membrane subunit
MNILSLLLLGAPTPATPNVGPWIHFFWVLLILCLILFVLWWVWTKISGMIPEPIRTIVMVLGVVALAAIIIIYVLMPLMGVF